MLNDLTWTLRYRAVWPTELLTSPDNLGAWLRAVDRSGDECGSTSPASNARMIAAARSRAPSLAKMLPT